MSDGNTCPDCDTATAMREGSEICPNQNCLVISIKRTNFELPRDENGVPQLGGEAYLGPTDDDSIVIRDHSDDRSD